MTDAVPQSSPSPKKPRQGRSPAFPFISLKKAIDRAEAFRIAEGGRPKHFAPSASAARAWGIGQKTGMAIQTVAALGHYGLFEFEGSGESRSMRLTDAALKILLDKQEISPERDQLLQKAALKPAIHMELWNKWGADLPSQSTLETYLVRDRGFSENGARTLIEEYKETISYAKLTESATLSLSEEEEVDSAMQQESSGSRAAAPKGAGLPYSTVFNRASGGEPFRVSFTGSGIEITGRITTAADADDLVNAVNALKLLLKPAGHAKRPDEPEEH